MSTPGATAVAQEQHATIRVLLISAAAALGGFLFGYDTAVINGAVDAIRGAFGLSAAATGFAVSCALLGSALGAWYAGPLADPAPLHPDGRVLCRLTAPQPVGIDTLDRKSERSDEEPSEEVLTGGGRATPALPVEGICRRLADRGCS